MKYQLLPPLSADDRAALEASIVAHGVLVPVEYDEDGAILDGHHRVEICEGLGLVDWPRFVRRGLSEPEKRTLARELNVSRRHLTSAQKRDLVEGQLRDTPSISSRAIAAMLGVDGKTVAKVRQQLVDAAEIPHHDEVEGRDGIKQPARKPIRTAFMPEADNRRELMKVAKGLRAEQQKTRHSVRLAHMDMVADRGQASAGKVERLYPVVYADPPWRFAVRAEDTGREKSAENHYPTMATPEICGLLAELGGVAARDAVLFLWATNPMLLDALGVVQAWGFTYKSHWIWDKEVAGTGYWGRDRHEALLIATRGDAVAPLPGTQPETVHRERKGRHSAKPAFFAETIERLYPGIAKIELFARTARPGWDVWGFEADPSIEPVARSSASDAGEVSETPAPPPGRTTGALPQAADRRQRKPAAPQGEAAARNLPADLRPSAVHVTELTIGGMRRNGSGRLNFHASPIGSSWSYQIDLGDVTGAAGPARGTHDTLEACVAQALCGCRDKLNEWAARKDSVITDRHRAAARGGARWCADRLSEWGLDTASDLRPAVSRRDYDDWKLLGLIDAGCTVSGPAVEAMRAGLFVDKDRLALTPRGKTMLAELDRLVKPAMADDGGVRIADEADKQVSP